MAEPMQAAGGNPGWVLVYTSAIAVVLVLRRPMVHKLPLGLLATCATLAILGGAAVQDCEQGSGHLRILTLRVQENLLWPTMPGWRATQCRARSADHSMGRNRDAGGRHSQFPFIGKKRPPPQTGDGNQALANP
jgi:hypothetical protein